MTKVGHFSSKSHCILLPHSANSKRLNFVIGRTNLQHNIYPFHTFDEARYSNHLIHLTWTALQLLSKAKVQKIVYDQFSVNMAARRMFGTRDLVWPRDLSVRELTRYDYSDRPLEKTRKKTNRQTNTLRNLNIVIYYRVIWNKSTFGIT